MDIHIIKKLSEVAEKNEKAALCTIVRTSGSSPLKAGASMIVFENGTIYGTVGGGAFEKSIADDAIRIIHDGMPQFSEHHLTRDHEMCCGGTVYVFTEPVSLPFRLYIFGGGHVGKALSEMATFVNFEVTVADERKNIFTGYPDNGARLINLNPLKVIPTLRWDKSAFAVILTYSHPLDRAILAACIRKPLGYLGMIGSRRKVIVTKRLFIEKGYATHEELEKVDMPIGIDVKAKTPNELAVGILAKLIIVKNKNFPVNEAECDLPKYESMKIE